MIDVDGTELYICPHCQEEYEIFRDMMDCYKGHYKEEIK